MTRDYRVHGSRFRVFRDLGSSVFRGLGFRVQDRVQELLRRQAELHSRIASGGL